MHAWDVSSDALLTARANAHYLGAQVDFVLQDALLAAENADNSPQYDFIVSNPPYICECEQADMAPQVWAHEPATALFVPNDQPLLFYQAIAHFAAKQLKSDGLLAFEINPLHADALYTLLYKGPFYDVEITPDHYGKQRFAWAKKQ
jgi:protein-(glutamine-N5) methyltransferase